MHGINFCLCAILFFDNLGDVIFLAIVQLQIYNFVLDHFGLNWTSNHPSLVLTDD